MDIAEFSNKLIETRLDNHLRFAKERAKVKEAFAYTSKVYGFPVKTKQEVEMILDEVMKINVEDDFIEVQHKEKTTHSRLRNKKEIGVRRLS